MGVRKLFTETTTVPCALEKDISRELPRLIVVLVVETHYASVGIFEAGL